MLLCLHGRTSLGLAAAPIEFIFNDIYEVFIILDTLFIGTALRTSCYQPSR
jgi:hypothetical protein